MPEVSVPITHLPLRFAVGEGQGLSSNSWRSWRGTDSTLYIACRDNYREMKASLHPACWQFGMTSEAWARHSKARNGPRHWQQWKPVNANSEGLRSVFRLEFIHSELAITPEMKLGRVWKEPVFIGQALGFEQTNVSVLIGRHDARYEFKDRPQIDLARVRISNDEDLLVVVSGADVLPAYRRALFDAYRANLPFGPIDAKVGHRMLIFGFDDLGSRFLTELHIVRPRSDTLFGPLSERS